MIRFVRFRIVSILWVLTLAAILGGWWLDHGHLKSQLLEEKERSHTLLQTSEELATAYNEGVDRANELRQLLQEAKAARENATRP